MDRAIEIIRKRTDAFGVSEPEISRIGSHSIRVGPPDGSNAAHAGEQVGQTAQVHFYDWEPNVIPNPAKANVGDRESAVGRPYDAGKGASAQTRECLQSKCAPAAPRCCLFASQPRQLLAGPAETRKDLFSDLPGQKQPPHSQILSVPQGTLVVQKEPDP